MDFSTDLESIIRFYEEGNDHFAYLNLVFVAVSLFLQMGMVLLQNKKRGVKTIVYEMLIVGFMIKPAIDAKRVVSGNVRLENSLVDPQFEATFNKCAEMFAESIPSSVLQTYAIFASQKISNRAVASICVSCLSIGYNSSTLAVTWDQDPYNRQTAPNFYGYIPDKGRLYVMIFMVFMTTSHVLMKVLACSILLRLNGLWFSLYVGGDMESTSYTKLREEIYDIGLSCQVFLVGWFQLLLDC